MTRPTTIIVTLRRLRRMSNLIGASAIAGVLFAAGPAHAQYFGANKVSPGF